MSLTKRSDQEIALRRRSARICRIDRLSDLIDAYVDELNSEFDS